MRTTQTLKFVNLARLLQIIRYDPVLYMNLNKLSELRYGCARQIDHKPQSERVSRMSNIRESAVERNRSNNMGSNLLSIIHKYTSAGTFLRELTEIIKRVN